MDSFDFDSLDPVALEQTLSYLEAYPEPQDHDLSFVQDFNDAVAERDWLGSPQEFVAGWEDQSRSNRSHVTLSAGTVIHSQSSLDNDMPLERDFDLQSHRKKYLQCSWDECSYSTWSELELTNHLDAHATNALKDWVAPAGCVWQGCKSKATFKYARSYEDHLKNIHTSPLVCTAPKCTHKRPFRNKADLSRHRSTAHSGLRPYICPYDNCPEEVNTFARRDKWLKHIRETPHEGDQFCPYLHCQFRNRADPAGFQTREGIAKHFKLAHSVYESDPYICALGSCVFNAQAEHWTASEFSSHLTGFHGPLSSGISSYYMRNKARLEGNARVLRAEYLDSSFTWHDCFICAQLQQPQQEFETDQTFSKYATFSC